MKWTWQQPDWPDFRYDNRALNDRELEFRLNSERLAGSFDALPMASQEDATIDLMLSEAIKTSASVKPAPAPHAKRTPWMKPYPRFV